MYGKIPEIEKYWLLLFYPNPKGSQQKPTFFESPLGDLGVKKENLPHTQ